MARFVIRFDLRAPDFGAPVADLYPAALEMAAWADRLGAEAIVLSEHHSADDGYMSAPLALAGAILGATREAPVSVQALLVPLHDPIRLAEDIGALDLVSRGRFSVVAGLGYRPEEYELFGVPWKGRGALMEEKLRVMVQAWTGEPFDYRGTAVRVTPKPYSVPHPLVLVGGSTEIAARRAGRLGLGFQPAIHDPQLRAWFEEESRANGFEPGLCIMPAPDVANVIVSHDPDATWAAVGQHLLHDTATYASWQREGQRSAVHRDVATVDELRADGLFQILTPDECVAFAKEPGRVLVFHPMCGGIDPATAWEGLRLFEHEVLPRL